MLWHFAIYLLIALAYLDASVSSFFRHERRQAWRELLITALYACVAFVVIGSMPVDQKLQVASRLLS